MKQEEMQSSADGPANDRCDVSVLGLGAMGARMAEVFLSQGKRVAVWNRSREKAEKLEIAGAQLCKTAEHAFRASPISVVVLLDHAAVQDVLWSMDVNDALTDRIIVNFTTTSMSESKALQEAFETAGAQYIKGSIVAYPRNIGHPESHAIYSGNSGSISAASTVLEIIAPNAISLPLAEAYAFSVMLHIHAFAATMSYYEAVAASTRFGIPAQKIARKLSDASRFFVGDAIEDAARRLEQGDFTGDQARLDVHASAFDYLSGAMHAQGASALLFDKVRQAARNACDAGYGGEDVVAMVKALAHIPSSRSEHSTDARTEGTPQ